MIKLIESFGYLISLTVSKFKEFLDIRSLSDNEKTDVTKNIQLDIFVIPYKTTIVIIYEIPQKTNWISTDNT